MCTPVEACVAPGPRVTMQTPGRPGQLAVGVRGVGRRRLVAAGDHAQAVAVRVEAVEQRQVALARHAERELDVVQRELVGEQLPAAPRHS